MSNFYELLDKIHQKPGVYISVPSVTNLYMFLCGYAFSRQEQGLAVTLEEETFDQFQVWVQQRFKVSASVSWAKVILLDSADERGGFEMFFELWNEFMDQQREISQGYKKVVA
jgi:hypothetical protein